MAGANAESRTIHAEQMLPDVLRRFPFLRGIFDRYGLRGCGGAHGPSESIAYFAQAHGVDLHRLLDELNAGVASPASVPPTTVQSPHALDRLADSIYRRFFKAGIVVVLTAGAAWGAFLLMRIALGRSFAAVTIHEINAHGHAQIFGWVGLFVMGFAYQAFPRMKHASLSRPDLANMSFYLMVFGIFARAVGEPLHAFPMFRELAIAAGLAEIAAIAIFAGVLVQTFRRSGKSYERNDAYVLAALAFFLVQAVYDLGLLYVTTATPNPASLLNLIETYQSPLRDLQIHGFALLMILGVGIRMFPALFGFVAPNRRLVRWSLVLLVIGVVGEAACSVLARRGGERPWAIASYCSMLIVAGASITLTFRWGLLAQPTDRDRGTKFVRASIAWLHVAMVMLILAPAYANMILPAASSLSASGRHAVAIGFSHAYLGSVRHAITVGFISLMILGMAGKIVPTLNGIDLRRLRPLWIPFALVNTGCIVRVCFEIATDFRAWAFPLMGVSGLVELTGIAAWAVHVWRIMDGWKPAELPAETRNNRITADDKIGIVAESYPQALSLLLAKGFAPLANPAFRASVAREISIRTAAEHHHLNLEEFLAELNAAVFGDPPPPARGISLPVLSRP